MREGSSVPLPDVATVIMGQSPPGSTYNDRGDGLPFFQGKAEFGDISPTPKKWCDAPQRIAEDGDILMSIRAPVGPTNLASERCCIGRGLAAIRADVARLDGSYLRFFLRHAEPKLASMGQGSTFAAIGRAEIASLRIPLPLLAEQHRIVDLLSRAEGIVHLRREAQAKAQAIIPALFLDMFGDPATNPKGWNEASFGNIVDNRDGQRRPVKAADRANRQGEYPYYGASGIIDYVDKYIFDGINLLVAEDGANLLSRSTPIAFQATGRYWVNNHAHVVGATDRVNLTYLETCLNLRDLHDFVTGSAQPKLTQKALNAIPIPLPPMQYQSRFETDAGQILSICHQQQEAATKAEATFQALLERAFSSGGYE